MIVIKRATDHQWFYVVKAANGKVLLTSETYRRRRNALKGIAALKKAMKNVKVKEDVKHY